MAEVSYTLTRVQDKYYIENTQGTILNYSLIKVHSIIGEETISEGTIAIGGTLTVPITKDGIYKVTLTEGINSSLIDLEYYLNLQVSALEDIFTTLCPCDCGCNDCTEKELDCCNIVTTKDKIDTYNMLTSPALANYFNVVNGQALSLIEEQTYCIINEEHIYGTSMYNNKLSKQIVALNYMAWYLYELDTFGTDDTQIAYIKAKFKQQSIYCCIYKLGIDIKAIEEAVTLI